MGFSGDYTRVFDSGVSTNDDWHPFVETTIPTGSKLFDIRCRVRARRMSNHDCAVWSQDFSFKREGSNDLEFVGASGLTLSLDVVTRDLGAALWQARIRLVDDVLFVEGKAGNYDVEWGADIYVEGFSTPPE